MFYRNSTAMGRHTTAHLYAVPVLAGFDAIRNCSHCRRSTDDDCKAWRQVRKAVAVLKQECRRYTKGVDELLAATGGRPANIYEYQSGRSPISLRTHLTLPKPGN